jgi:hypothetical protein
MRSGGAHQLCRQVRQIRLLVHVLLGVTLLLAASLGVLTCGMLQRPQ